MQGEYCLDRISESIYALAKAKEDGSTENVLKQYAKKRANRESAEMAAETFRKIERIGIARAIEIQMITLLGKGLAEIHVNKTVIRVFAFQDYKILVVLGFERGHQGKTANIQRFIESYEERRIAAEALVAEMEEVHGQERVFAGDAGSGTGDDGGFARFSPRLRVYGKRA